MERYGLMAVVPTLTALLLLSLNNLQLIFVYLYALLEFSRAKHYREMYLSPSFSLRWIGNTNGQPWITPKVWRLNFDLTEQDRFCCYFGVADRFDWIKSDVWLKQAFF